MAGEEPYKLPVWPLVKKSYGKAMDDLAYVMRIGWPAFLLLALLIVVQQLVKVESFWISLLSHILSTFALAPFAVAWHRFVLLDEKTQDRLYFRMDRLVVVYALYAFLLENLLFPFNLLPNIDFSSVGLPSEAVTTLGVIVFAGLLYLTTRLSMVLPARAIGADQISLGASWQMTGGNGLRLFMGIVLVTLIFAGAVLALVFAITLLSYLVFSSVSGVVVAYLFLIPAMVLWLAADLAYLSHAFTLLHGGAEAE